MVNILYSVQDISQSQQALQDGFEREKKKAINSALILEIVGKGNRWFLSLKKKAQAVGNIY